MRARWWAASAAALLALLVLWFLQRGAQPLSDPASTVQAPALTAPTAVEVAPPATPAPTISDVTTSRLGVKVRLIKRPSRRPRPPYGPAFAQLEAAAKAGDVDAQHGLGLLLYDCNAVPADSAALERAIDQMRQTHRRDGWNVGEPAMEEASMRSLFADCEGVPSEARVQYRDWLKQAADAGLVQAQLDLPLRLPPGDWCQFLSSCAPEQRAKQEALQKEALDYIGRARDAGSAEALWTFGAWYEQGEVLPEDDVEAYAHFLALDEIHAATGERRFNQMLEELRARLRPVDLERAEARARELLANPNCCVVTP